MLFNGATTLAVNFFRVSYEGTQALFQPTLPATAGRAERLERVIAAQVALVDAFFTLGQYTYASFDLERLRGAIIPLRLLAIGHGIYRLAFDQNRDPLPIQEQILLHALNVGHFAMRVLQMRTTHPFLQRILPHASRVCLLADPVYRIFCLFLHRTAIANRASDLYDHPIIHRIKQGVLSVLSVADVALRALIGAVSVALMYLMSFTLILQSSLSIPLLPMGAQSPIPISFTAMGALGCSLTAFLSMAIHEILNDLGFQHRHGDRWIDGIVAAPVAACLTAAIAVGLGLADSISDVFKGSYPPILTVALCVSLAYLFKQAFHALHDQFGIQRNTVDIEWFFAVLGALSLTCSAAHGFKLTKTLGQPLRFIVPVCYVFTGCLMMMLATETMRDMLRDGPPSWQTIFKTLYESTIG